MFSMSLNKASTNDVGRGVWDIYTPYGVYLCTVIGYDDANRLLEVLNSISVKV